jgi:hypothetical protein
MATFIVAYTGLYYLFQEKSMASHISGTSTAELLQCQNLCRDNLETALANLPLLMPARMGNIEALLLGVGNWNFLLMIPPPLYYYYAQQQT